uniref:Uncharacterized protein n=1 Tax=Ostreococcus mediterraneus TaxID=1486918 RepID=A0A6U0ANQ8_9CHLO|mmetsp:Transcript_1162/g.3641  ORF Transcript_1162/g.3641 Transcript_1162/m.3641 type:complete len:181 (+) Transcript_1162:77-619(+)
MFTVSIAPNATRARVAHKSRRVHAQANAARFSPATTHVTRQVAQIAAKAPPPPPPAKFLSAAQYVQAASVVFGVYTAQMLLVPAKMVSDHFNATPTSMEKFWIRGSSAGFGAAIYAMSLLATNQAAQVAFYLAAAVAVLLPFNAKFNLFKDNLSVKYPMHYVPEVLMATLTLLGAYVLYL